MCGNREELIFVVLYVGKERVGGREGGRLEARGEAGKGWGRKTAPRVTAVVEAQDAVSQYYRCVKPPRLSWRREGQGKRR